MPNKSKSEPSESEIQREAYLLWLASGCEPGRDLDHWLAAKELLRHRTARPSGARPRKGPALMAVALHFPPSHEVIRPVVPPAKS